MGWFNRLVEDVNGVDRASGLSPLHVAAQSGELERLRDLIARGADVNKPSSQTGGTPLHYAAESGRLAIARALLDSGADVDARAGLARVDMSSGYRDRVGQANTPLMFAAAEGHPKMIELLLDRGAEIDADNHDGGTALFLAAQRGQSAAVETLLRRGADPGRATGRGALPLHIAAERGRTAAVKALLAGGSPVDQPTPQNRDTPLHDAAQNGHDEIVAMLLAHGAKPNSLARMNLTPLHLAAHAGSLAVVRRLLDHGADASIRNEAGYTAEDLACDHPSAEAKVKPAIIAELNKPRGPAGAAAPKPAAPVAPPPAPAAAAVRPPPAPPRPASPPPLPPAAPPPPPLPPPLPPLPPQQEGPSAASMRGKPLIVIVGLGCDEEKAALKAADSQGVNVIAAADAGSLRLPAVTVGRSLFKYRFAAPQTTGWSEAKIAAWSKEILEQAGYGYDQADRWRVQQANVHGTIAITLVFYWDNGLDTGTCRLLAEKLERAVPRELGAEDRALVDRLIAAYPGYLPRREGTVRQIGRALDERGGIALMLNAHRLVSERLGRTAGRELEVAWDGIGEWMG
jgi:ankyrin repeat protein